MTQYEVQTIECAGIPFTEYRYEEKALVTIEFSVDSDEYSYEQPEFIFTDKVCLRQNLQEGIESGTSPDEMEIGVVLGLELVEFRSGGGRLTSLPHWLIGVRWGRTTELKWYYEVELIPERDIMPAAFSEF